MIVTTLKAHSDVIRAIGSNKVDAYWAMIKNGSTIQKAIASLSDQFTDREFLESYGLSVYDCYGQRMTNFSGDWSEEVFNFCVVAPSEQEAEEKAQDYAFSRYGIHCVGAGLGSLDDSSFNITAESWFDEDTK